MRTKDGRRLHLKAAFRTLVKRWLLFLYSLRGRLEWGQVAENPFFSTCRSGAGPPPALIFGLAPGRFNTDHIDRWTGELAAFPQGKERTNEIHSANKVERHLHELAYPNEVSGERQPERGQA